LIDLKLRKYRLFRQERCTGKIHNHRNRQPIICFQISY